MSYICNTARFFGHSLHPILGTSNLSDFLKCASIKAHSLCQKALGILKHTVSHITVSRPLKMPCAPTTQPPFQPLVTVDLFSISLFCILAEFDLLHGLLHASISIFWRPRTLGVPHTAVTRLFPFIAALCICPQPDFTTETAPAKVTNGFLVAKPRGPPSPAWPPPAARSLGAPFSRQVLLLVTPSLPGR